MAPTVLKSRHIPGAASALEAYEKYYDLGWTDGLPIIPPTEALVRAMLETTDRDPQEVVAFLPPTEAAATVEKIAINAVMAGCRPEYLPVVIAIVEAISDPGFRVLPVGTNPGAPLTVINGPVRQRININCGYNTLGNGPRSNLTIGRAVRLILQNVGQRGAHGVRDQTTIGTPGRISMCIGELEEASPWEPLHVERGFPKEASTVTVFNAVSILNIADGNDKTADGLLTTIAHSMTSHGNNNFRRPTEPLLILGPDHAGILGAAGLSKSDVKRLLWERAKVPVAQLSPDIREAVAGKRGRTVVRGFMHITEDTDGLSIAVAGGSGPHSVFIPSIGAQARQAVTKEIRFRLG